MTATGIDLYTATAAESATLVIRRYSTSFGWASRLLNKSAKQHIANIYGLVRLADEIVDGPAEAAGADVVTRRKLLDELEADTTRALKLGYSANLIVHAFAQTARAHGINTELTEPFFSSMRSDLAQTVFDDAALGAYIYGSAEVIGLMCLAVFERGRVRSAGDTELLRAGARGLGAAFQKINFLRDFADDHDLLGRAYFPGTAKGLTEQAKSEALASIRADLRAADAAMPLLERRCRAAVWAAREMFCELAERLESRSAAELMRTRVRVPDPVKVRILARALTMRAGL